MPEIEEKEIKKGKQIDRYWTHPEDETINIERDAGNWILNIKNKSTFHTSKQNALKKLTEMLFIKTLPDISDEDKRSLVKMAEYERKHYEFMQELFKV